MRARDVQVGGTYLVEVPHRLPTDPGRWPIPALALTSSLWWRLVWLRGTRFRLTITEIDRSADPAVAAGLRVIDQCVVAVELTGAQIDELGLPPGHYRVEGPLRDENHHVVDLPEVESLTVPVRWLHPPDARRPRTHRDIDHQRW